jgi:UDP-glucose 6-dehydrogenase
LLKEFYKHYFSNAEITETTETTSTESESIKIFCNSFYSVKVQFFTEIYLLCKKLNMDCNKIKDLMIKNGWINNMHTNIPGPDRQISFISFKFIHVKIRC